MGKQYHFVVQFDTDDNEFSIDIDTLYTMFSDGFTYDTDTQEWIVEPEDGGADYLAKEQLLSAWLQACNEESF